MRAGPLRHRVQIQTVTEARDSYGGVVETWATVATRWGAVEPLYSQGRAETLDADRMQSEATHRVRLRHYSGLTPKHRLIARGKTLEIERVVNVNERDRETVVLAVERG